MIAPDIDVVKNQENPKNNSFKVVLPGVESNITGLLTQLNAVAIRLKQRGGATPGQAQGPTTAEHAVLDVVQRCGALTVPQIARERSTSRQNIQILVDRLEQQGDIQFTGNPAHKRSALVRMTAKGEASLADGDQGQQQLIDEIKALLSEEEIREAASVLQKINSLLCTENHLPNRAQPSTRSQAILEQKAVKRAEEESKPEEFPINLL